MLKKQWKFKTLLFIPLLLLIGCPNSTGPSISFYDVPGGYDTTDSAQADIHLKDGQICIPGTHQCLGNNFLTCNKDGSDWDVQKCPEGTNCTPRGCENTECRPGESRCYSKSSLQICKTDGSGWGKPEDCPKNNTCISGTCVPNRCRAGQKTCIKNAVAVCKEDNSGWTTQECKDNEVCFEGKCIECIADANCPEGMVCKDGSCMAKPPRITTDVLPPGRVGKPYMAKIEAKGGNPPYTFSIINGALPTGLTIKKDIIAGTPTSLGKFDFTVKLTDTNGLTDQKDLEIVIADKGLQIISKNPLPPAEAESPYTFKFQAAGGTPPYGWILLKGNLPKGFVLASSGVLQGTTEDPGDYHFSIRVVDNSDPIQDARAEFDLTVKVAPLRIVGDKVLNLYVAKIVILPLITVVQNIPVPYQTKLKAKGGLKPYHWKEVPVPGFLKQWFPKAGLPKGLTLNDDGTLSGSVTDTSQVMEVKIPMSQITLKGFAFMAKVTDSQKKPDSDQGLFFIPTVPVNFGGGGGGLPF